jgi:hypothetical protein
MAGFFIMDTVMDVPDIRSVLLSTRPKPLELGKKAAVYPQTPIYVRTGKCLHHAQARRVAAQGRSGRDGHLMLQEPPSAIAPSLGFWLAHMGGGIQLQAERVDQIHLGL